MATPPFSPELPPEQLYLAHLKLIDQIAVHAARRRHFSREETEDFVSTVHVRLLVNDYAVIRKFEGKSSFRTYLVTVIGHLFQDHCNRLFGKWRPTEEIKRLGPVAVRLSELTMRDKLTFDQACELLRTNEHVELSRKELQDLFDQLPPAHPRPQIRGEEEIGDPEDEREAPDERVLARELAERKEKVLILLRKALASLPQDDRLIARMRVEFQVSKIAKTLGLDQKPLYRRIEKILKTLRSELEAQGISRADIAEILSFPERDDEPS